MIFLRSSAINWVKYDIPSENLTIAFTSGGIYTFKDIPAEQFMGLVTANSPGRYYNTYI